MAGVGHPLNATPPADGEADWAGDRADYDAAVKDAIEAKVTSDALDLQADVDLQGNSLKNVESVQHTAVADPGTSRTQYVGTDGELYFRDGSGRLVKQTSNGTVNTQLSGGIQGDYVGSSAQVAYTASNGTFGFTSSPGSFATLETGDHKIHRGSGTSAVDVTASPNLTASYEFRLPQGPLGQTGLVTMDNTGTLNVSRQPAVDFLTASILTGPGAVPQMTLTGTIVLSGTLPRTIFQRSFHWADAQGNSNANFANTGWTFSAPSPNIVTLGIMCEPGERILSIQGWYTRSSKLTASFFEDNAAGAANQYALKVIGSGSGNSFVLDAGSSSSGTLPFQTSATSSLRLVVSGSTGDAVYGPVVVAYDRPIGK